MKIDQWIFTEKNGWKNTQDQGAGQNAQWVMVFSDTATLSKKEVTEKIQSRYPTAFITINSTSGEIHDQSFYQNSISLHAIHFENTQIRASHINLNDFKNSYLAGKQLAKNLHFEDLKHIFLISEGLKVNGSKLVKGVLSLLPKNVAVTGGLAGDGDDFNQTLVGLNQVPKEGEIIAIGFYSKSLQIGYGSKGGWRPFGPKRNVSKSAGNVLFLLDDKSALDLYKTYLGEHAENLPSTGLLFPLSVKETNKPEVVRTLLAVDHENKSMTFAGDIPEGALVQFMKASTDELIDGAIQAAQNAVSAGVENPDLAILVSCVGRKLVMKQRVEEEIENVKDILGPQTSLAGFYSYGEICPYSKDHFCDLHNQTMTITTFKE